MKIRRTCIAASFALVGLGCGDNMTMMSDYGADLDRHVDALRAEQTAHSSEVAAARDVDAIGRAENDHWQRNNDHMKNMGMVMDDMMSCHDTRGNTVDHANVAGMMQNMRDECDQHRDAMRDLPDVDTRRSEEARHHDAMKGWLDQMHTGIGTMMSGQGNGASCGHCAHCGM